MPGLGTVLNVVTVLIGSALGATLGDRLPHRVRDRVTDGLGLVTLVVGGLSVAALADPVLRDTLGPGRPLLIVLASVTVGGVAGALLRLEDRLDSLGGYLQGTLGGRSASEESRHRYIEGFVTASLVFCVGPLTILGSLQDGMGDGIELLALKSVLDGFAALAFAASLGWGVAASAVTVFVVQGSLTILGVAAGHVLSDVQVTLLTATGGVLLLGVGLRLLNVRAVAVGDLLPALLVAPLATLIVERIA